ncbi:MAG: SpoIID/LytB domain-containing protein [Elusimicrobia bacterium]|nr:SpoIID/LytB domain-containing protein [Elusimicrobiota bacterium]
MILFALLAWFSCVDAHGNGLEEAHSLYYQGRLDDAERAYYSASKNPALRAEAYKNLAVIYRDQGLHKKALALLKKARRLNPRDPRVAEQLAWSYWLRGKSQAAQNEAEYALRLSSSTLAQFTLGLGRLEQGKIREAKMILESLNKRASYFLPAYFELGRLYENEKNWNRAKQLYRSLAKLDYTYLEAKRPLERVTSELNIRTGHRPQASLIRSNGAREATPEKPNGRDENPDQERRIPLAHQRYITPRLRIGLGTSSGGNSLTNSGIMFRAKGPFRMYRKDGGRLIAEGQSGQIWQVRASTPEGSLTVIKPDGRKLGPFAKTIIIETDKSIFPILIHNVSYGHGFAWAGSQDRQYRGRIELTPDEKAGVIVVNDIILEEYLYSVLPGEMPPGIPQETLKAQAVIARSNALYRHETETAHPNQPYDLCDGQHCQVYVGLSGERPGERRAVNQTRGIILTHKGRVIHALFHANCGGHTQTAADIPDWLGEPYLQAVADTRSEPPQSPWATDLWLKSLPEAFCEISDHVHPLSFRWLWVINSSELEERLNRIQKIGRLKNILQLKRGPAGYLHNLRFIGTDGALTIRKEHEIRRVLAMGLVRSTMLAMDMRRDKKGRPQEIYLFGGGWGHGVGLCQGGAANLAETENYNYEKILRHYYADVRLETLKWGR